jgi:protocatechuate 3,4-dioxygenase beta subunit
MQNDDQLRGYMLTRREALTMLGVSGVALLTGCRGSGTRVSADTATSSSISAGAGPQESMCVVRPEMTEGPYFVDEMLNRSDIRRDPSDGSVKPGAPLQLTFNVSTLAAAACTPLAGALVDLWHCDHLGVYSDVSDPGFNTVGKKFLRGYQVTDASGLVRFATVYPGWYQGRAVHIHFKIRSARSASRGFEFTSQLFFDDVLTDRVHAQQPYAAKGQRTVRNSRDGIFRRGGSQLLLSLTEASSGGYTGTLDIALQNV